MQGAPDVFRPAFYCLLIRERRYCNVEERGCPIAGGQQTASSPAKQTASLFDQKQ